MGCIGIISGLGFRVCRGTILRVPVIRTIIFWSLSLGPLILGNYDVCCRATRRHSCPSVPGSCTVPLLDHKIPY